jgi:GTPase SAR1 family protein
MFFETSAKTAEHVSECFMELTSRIVQELEKSQVKKKNDSSNLNTLDLGNKNNAQNRKAGGCC